MKKILLVSAVAALALGMFLAACKKEDGSGSGSGSGSDKECHCYAAASGSSDYIVAYPHVYGVKTCAQVEPIVSKNMHRTMACKKP